MAPKQSRSEPTNCQGTVTTAPTIPGSQRADLLLVAALTASVKARWQAPLEAFGRSPLFFYLLHLWVFGLLSFGFPAGTSFPVRSDPFACSAGGPPGAVVAVLTES